ncbi:unnamed protein product [Brassicogethes aeneus]|uniref:Serine/threonine-protein phosphatase n=1 Tax=Brassicogethes aeneus TaxID=1431903 RepID=A0A9P0FKT3_BRAAE|nr:unnamed protein product [Brassicogethes aeneus]
MADCTKNNSEIELEVSNSKGNEASSAGKQARPIKTVWYRKWGRFIYYYTFGCGCCIKEEISMTKLEKTVKATLLIQQWYRRYIARLEVRRRCTWTIFQTLEYAGECDQVKLYSFFNALLTHIPSTANAPGSNLSSRSSSLENLDNRYEDESPDPDEEFMDAEQKSLMTYKINFPLTEADITKLLEVFKKRRHYRLPPDVVAEILIRAVRVLKTLPNLNKASTSISKQITICGDLHGKFEDLLVIFHKNGLPSSENPYVFNGDFVDRGKRGLEVLLILLCCLLVYPDSVYLNRGNHEDHIMNQRYGFVREVQSKYKRNSEKLLRLIEEVFRHLPLGTILNNKVLIVHGGISDTTDLEMLKLLDRTKYVSLLRPPVSEVGTEAIDKMEWKQVFDILWSDPQTTDGCIPNQLRGAGTYFGPNVTKQFLEKYKLSYLVRSHECKPEGYEVVHENKVITIFSASNYYEMGSNNGAYLKVVGDNLDTHYVQYMAKSGRKNLTFFQRMSMVETGAIKELQMQISSNEDKLLNLFNTYDPENVGLITVTQWCKSMEAGTNLQIPWRLLKEKLVTIDADTGKVKYSTTFEVNKTLTHINSVQGASTVVETLYRNKRSLEAIFRIIDKDNSGHISFDEFADACNLIKEHFQSPMTKDQLKELCKLMDLNKDGMVDLNEFLESFRMVDPESKKTNLANSPEPEEPPSGCRTIEPPKFLDVDSIKISKKNRDGDTPPISPAIVKPLKLMPKIDEENLAKLSKIEDLSASEVEHKADVEKNQENLRNGKKELYDATVKVVVHQPSPSEANCQNTILKTDGKSSTGHVNPMQMSPVLSSRRGN